MASACDENNQTDINSTTEPVFFCINNEDFIFETVGGGRSYMISWSKLFFHMQLSLEIMFSNPGDKLMEPSNP